ncbi:MAG TPA: GNAT family N-acetyltransferase [Candidatus Limnocylindria bacterium]|nr:GNAT family N-acetyltransferase [Candidatus Limnocylindria bacterium]
MDIRAYRDGDGDRLRTFWLACGVKIRPGDDDASLRAFATRNPDLFILAEEHGHLVGSALAGWDGRRGWLYHVAVHPDERRRGLGRELVAEAGQRLRELGCLKLNLIVWDDNTHALRFWESLGFRREKTVEYAKEL